MKIKEALKGNEINTCILCGEEVKPIAQTIQIRCDYCGKMSATSYQCSNSHYICDDCYEMSAGEFIKSICLKYKGNSPIDLAVKIMNAPAIRAHGPEHHFILPAVLMTCIHNRLGRTEDLASILDNIEQRALNEAPNACQFNLGSCGAAIGTGIFLSVYTNRDPQTEDEWSMTNNLIAECLKAIAEYNLSRCCKRDTYICIKTVVNFLKEKFAVDLPLTEAKCTFSLRNQTCKREECPYYNLQNSLV